MRADPIKNFSDPFFRLVDPRTRLGRQNLCFFKLQEKTGSPWYPQCPGYLGTLYTLATLHPLSTLGTLSILGTLRVSSGYPQSTIRVPLYPMFQLFWNWPSATLPPDTPVWLLDKLWGLKPASDTELPQSRVIQQSGVIHNQ